MPKDVKELSAASVGSAAYFPRKTKALENLFSPLAQSSDNCIMGPCERLRLAGWHWRRRHDDDQ